MARHAFLGSKKLLGCCRVMKEAPHPQTCKHGARKRSGSDPWTVRVSMRYTITACATVRIFGVWVRRFIWTCSPLTRAALACRKWTLVIGYCMPPIDLQLLYSPESESVNGWDGLNCGHLCFRRCREPLVLGTDGLTARRRYRMGRCRRACVCARFLLGGCGGKVAY